MKKLIIGIVFGMTLIIGCGDDEESCVDVSGVWIEEFNDCMSVGELEVTQDGCKFSGYYQDMKVLEGTVNGNYISFTTPEFLSLTCSGTIKDKNNKKVVEGTCNAGTANECSFLYYCIGDDGGGASCNLDSYDNATADIRSNAMDCALSCGSSYTCVCRCYMQADVSLEYYCNIYLCSWEGRGDCNLGRCSEP